MSQPTEEKIEISLELFNLLLVENPQMTNWKNGKLLLFKKSTWYLEPKSVKAKNGATNE